MNSQQAKKLDIPDKPGVYFFVARDQILYIGKATSLQSRVKSYFSKDLVATRGLGLVSMLNQATNIKWQETDSVLEALILEANLIKKHNPKYNTKEKDDKSYNFVVITKDVFPRIMIIRGRILNQEKNKKKYKKIFGPYTSGESLRTALSIIRRIFPYLDEKSLKKDRYEFYKQLHLVPEIGKDGTAPSLDKGKTGVGVLKRYKKTIKNIEDFLSGKKAMVVKSLEKEMLQASRKMQFEYANEIKKRIFAINHIRDIALLKATPEHTFTSAMTMTDNSIDSVGRSFTKYVPAPQSGRGLRLEAYDIAHISGSAMVGVMVVMINGEFDKNEYRIFNIKGFTKSNDAGALKEVLERRIQHKEWAMPSIVVMDGNQVQKSVAEKVFGATKVVAVVKDDRHRAKAIIGDATIIEKYKKDILKINTEAHRFALSTHKKKRANKFLPKK